MFGWLREKGRQAFLSSHQAELENWLTKLRAMDAQELGMVAILTCHARVIWFASGNQNLLLPDLCIYEDKFVVFKIGRQIESAQRDSSHGAVTGLFPWLFTLRACVHVELRPKTLEMWDQIDRGSPHISDFDDLRCQFQYKISEDEYKLRPSGFFR
jgi:hypothetical protein